MRVVFLPVLVTVIMSIATMSVAQSPGSMPAHQIDAIGLTFVDEDDGANITTVTLGEEIQWNFVSGALHTITSGTGSADPDSGNLFDEQNFTVGDVFFFFPQACGVFPYYCQIHENFNMVGTIIVTSPPAAFPGSGDDLMLQTGVFGPPDCFDEEVANVFDQVTVELTSPNGTFDAGVGIIAIELFPGFSVGAGSPPGLPGVHLRPANAIVLAIAPMGGAGITVSNSVAFFLDGLTGLVQGFVIDGAANNGLIASTDAHRIHFVGILAIDDD